MGNASLDGDDGGASLDGSDGGAALNGCYGCASLNGDDGCAALDGEILSRRVEGLRSLAYYIVWAIQKTKEASSQMASFKLLG